MSELTMDGPSCPLGEPQATDEDATFIVRDPASGVIYALRDGAFVTTPDCRVWQLTGGTWVEDVPFPARAARTAGEAPVSWWVCGNGHVFSHGDEDWHATSSQPDGAPTHCWQTEADDQMCLDSTHLHGPLATYSDAEVLASSISTRNDADTTDDDATDDDRSRDV